MASPVTDMDFDNPRLPSSKEKKEELLHTEQEKGVQQYKSTAEGRKRNPTTPKQTESIRALNSAGPIIPIENEGMQDIVETARPALAAERSRMQTPTPEDCAVFLADIISVGKIKTLLRNLTLNSVSIADIEERHRNDPKEFRIEGIKTGIVSAKGDRIIFLLSALKKSELNHQAELFCEKFNIKCPALEVQPTQAKMEEPTVVEQPRMQTPTPEECAIFLADKIDSWKIKTLLRNLTLNSVSITDIEERHRNYPKEFRIEGIKTGIVSAKGDRITFLLNALKKSGLNHQAELFCDEFNIKQPSLGGAEAEDVQRKFNDMVLIGDEQLDASLSVEPELRLEAILMKDLTMTDAKGKKSALHGSKESQLEHCHLGGGSFGEVYKVNHAVYGDVAVKLAKPGKGDRIKMYQKEVEKHVIAITSDDVVSIKGFVQCEDEGCNCGLIGFVMKYMELGSLWDFRINRWKDAPDLQPLTNKMVYQISSGMHFLHSKDIIHRDLKLENVLVTAKLDVKIADLGLATNLKTSSGDNCWGTNSHKPPEAFRTDLPDSTKVVTQKYDVYSFAMTLYELLTGIHPYSDRGFDMIRLLKVESKRTPSLGPIPKNTTPELITILKESWRYEPHDRPDFTDITNRVANLDTDLTNKSLAVYLAQPSSIKKEGETASKVTKPVLPPNADDESVRGGMENLTVNDQVSAKPRGSKTGTVPTPTTETMKQGIPESLSQSGSALCGPKGDVWPVTSSKPPIASEVITPLESSQSPKFGRSGSWISGQESGCQDDNVQSQTGAERCMKPGGLVNPSIEDPPRQGAFTSLRSNIGHDQEQGKCSETKHELLSNPPVWNKQEVYSPNGQTPSKSGLVQPDLSGGNTLGSGSGDYSPVQADSRQGRTELVVGPMAGGTTYIHQESSPVTQSQPSSSERDPTIVFDSTPISDQDFEIKLQVSLTIPIRASISSKMEQILTSLERCKHRAYWPTNNFLCMILSSHDITLQTLQLPPTVDEDQFTLFLRMSGKSALEKLHSFSENGKLHAWLVTCFVDSDLKGKCLPAKPNLNVESWQEQFNRGMEHFKKKDKGDDSSQSESEHRESKSERPKETKSNVFVSQKDCSGAMHINTESTEKVNTDTLLGVVDRIPGDTVKFLGRHLEMEEVQVDNILYENRNERSSEQAYQVLREWKQQRGQQATKAVLANALWKAKCYDAARNVR